MTYIVACILKFILCRGESNTMTMFCIALLIVIITSRVHNVYHRVSTHQLIYKITNLQYMHTITWLGIYPCIYRATIEVQSANQFYQSCHCFAVWLQVDTRVEKYDNVTTYIHIKYYMTLYKPHIYSSVNAKN